MKAKARGNAPIRATGAAETESRPVPDLTDEWLRILADASSIGDGEAVAKAETLVLQTIYSTWVAFIGEGGDASPELRPDRIRQAVAAVWREHNHRRALSVPYNLQRALWVVALAKAGNSLANSYTMVAEHEGIDQDSVKESVRRARKAHQTYRTFTIDVERLKVSCADPFLALPHKPGRPPRN